MRGLFFSALLILLAGPVWAGEARPVEEAIKRNLPAFLRGFVPSMTKGKSGIKRAPACPALPASDLPPLVLRNHAWIYSIRAFGMDLGRADLRPTKTSWGSGLRLDARLRGPVANVLGSRVTLVSHKPKKGMPDGLSFLRKLRAKKLVPGACFSARVLVDGTVWILRGKVLGPVRLSMPFGPQPALVLEIQARRRGRRQKVALKIWLSDDVWRMPLRIEGRGDFGRVDISLKRCLRFSLSSAGCPSRKNCRSRLL
ncbi:MAG: DUF3108 domain-containing protein [Deltaproteobacteria bacterium]|nr:DUF3108 domain-containing protein [Deltaproteobacteria bacterium]